jgi:hypothetical protein
MEIPTATKRDQENPNLKHETSERERERETEKGRERPEGRQTM